jgi:hypothetical protein
MLKTNRLITALLVALCFGGAPARAQSGDALKPGMTLDQSNWQLAQDLLPTEILEHYKTGGYANPIIDFPLGLYEWPPDFKGSTEKNAGQFKISDQGSVVLNSTGEQPPYILGYPFPIIDASDPQAATKILWNYVYLTWYYGNLVSQQAVMDLPIVGSRGRNPLDLVLTQPGVVSGAPTGGGIYRNNLYDGTVTVKNSIVANSPRGGNCAGVVINNGFNLSSDGFCGFTQVANVLLGPLTANGGPTLTHMPLPGSPALDFVAGNCPPPATDQRGAARPIGALCDAGAVEYGAAVPMLSLPLVRT